MKTKTPNNPKPKGEVITDEVRYLPDAIELIRMEHADGEPESMPKIRGYAAKFNVLSEFMYGVRERILPGAFDDVLDDDVRALVNHDGVPLARTRSKTLSIGIDDVGLWYEFTPADTPEARSLIEALDREDIDQSSFRFSVLSSGYDYVEDENDGIVREISKISRLRDVSIVTFPAYPDASAELQRSLDDFKRTLEGKDEDMSGPLKALADANQALAES